MYSAGTNDFALQLVYNYLHKKRKKSPQRRENRKRDIISNTQPPKLSSVADERGKCLLIYVHIGIEGKQSHKCTKSYRKVFGMSIWKYANSYSYIIIQHTLRFLFHGQIN